MVRFVSQVKLHHDLNCEDRTALSLTPGAFPLFVGDRQYTTSIDMWGAGCIMAELWTRSPIMQGDTEQKQLTMICNLCGSIDKDSWDRVW